MLKRMPIEAGSEADRKTFERELFDEIDKVFELNSKFILSSGGQYPYGFTPEERPIVKRIVLERAKGISYRDIAAALNLEKVPTKRKVRWHSWTITNIVAWVCRRHEEITARLEPVERVYKNAPFIEQLSKELSGETDPVMKRIHSRLFCGYCKVNGHDKRLHRSQVNKKAFTPAEVKALGYDWIASARSAGSVPEYPWEKDGLSDAEAWERLTKT